MLSAGLVHIASTFIGALGFFSMSVTDPRIFASGRLASASAEGRVCAGLWMEGTLVGLPLEEARSCLRRACEGSGGEEGQGDGLSGWERQPPDAHVKATLGAQ